MKIATVLFLQIFINWNLYSQISFPSFTNSPTWKVFVQGTPGSFTDSIYYSSDTALCGKIYSIVRSKHFGRICYSRVENSKVFFKKNNDCGTKEYLLYDFSLVKGDSVYCGVISSFTNIDTAIYKVDFVDSIEIFSIKRKRMKLSYQVFDHREPPISQMVWIEGIGSTTKPFHSFTDLYGDSLLCYSQNDALLFMNSYFNSCDITILDIEQISKKCIFSVYPNPFIDYIRIKNYNGKLAIKNALGEIVFFVNNYSENNPINLNALRIGIYIVELLDNKINDYQLKIIKIN